MNQLVILGLLSSLCVGCGGDDVNPDAGTDSGGVDSGDDSGPRDVGPDDVGPDDAGLDDAGPDDAGPDDAAPDVVSDDGGPLTGLVFETDFSMDTGYHATNLGVWNARGTLPPTGWDGILATGSGIISVEPEGVGGSNALKLAWDPVMAQPTLSLVRHLTGDVSTGYPELYVRYRVRLPADFKAGSGGSTLPYWKWGRLWQNTSPTDRSSWTENRPDSFYVLWNFGGRVPDANITWGANSGVNLDRGSAGGERAIVDWFVSGADRTTQGGYFESMGGGEWAIDPADGRLLVRTQTWHTIEYHFALASSVGADDGICEMWWDGVEQSPYTRIRSQAGAPTYTGVPTAVHGSGFNFLMLFHNMAVWNEDWDLPGVDGHIFVNDVVVSTARIGDGYTPVGTTP